MVAPETIARILFLDIGCPERGPAADPQVGLAASLARQDRPRRKDEVDDTGVEIDRRENPGHERPLRQRMDIALVKHLLKRKVEHSGWKREGGDIRSAKKLADDLI